MCLKVPHFATSVYKSTNPFGLSFAYDTPKIWSDLPDDAHSCTSLQSFRKKLKTYLFAQASKRFFSFIMDEIHFVFSHGVVMGGWAGGGKWFVLAVSEIVRCRKLILRRDIGWGL